MTTATAIVRDTGCVVSANKKMAERISDGHALWLVRDP